LLSFYGLKHIHSQDHQKLCALLRDARAQVGITQAELAARLDVAQSFVSKYESGERRLDVLELRAVCTALGTSFNKFVRSIDQELS